jgi:hypothetical protein
MASPLSRIALPALLAALAACREAPSGDAAGADPGDEGADAAAGAPAASALPPRRPTRRYYLARTRERCVVYSVDGDAISPPTEVPCPAELQRGERLRLAGKTCARESPADPARDVPVVCPDPLTRAEAIELAADAGP